MNLADALAEEVRKASSRYDACVICDTFKGADLELIDKALVKKMPSKVALCAAIRKAGGPVVTRHQLERHKRDHLKEAAKAGEAKRAR